MSNDFMSKLRYHGGGTLFLVGIILFSAANLINVFLSFNVASLFSLALLALPITGLWLIFAAAKRPALPEKTLVSLTLFRVLMIIELVLFHIAAAVFVIIAIIVATQAGIGGAFFALILIAGVLELYVYFYYKAILGILKRLRTGIDHNSLGFMPEVKLFSILTYVRVGFTVVVALLLAMIAGILSGMIDMIFGEMMGMMDMLGMGNLLGGLTDALDGMALSAFLTMAASAGVVICVIVLNNFNKSIAAPMVSQAVQPPFQSQPTRYTPPYTPPPQPALPRMPLIFLIDTSSAARPYISSLNASLNHFKAGISHAGQAQGILDVAVVQFDDKVNVMQDFAPVEDMRPVRLLTAGAAAYSGPVRQTLRMAEARTFSAPGCKPWIILISGSRPTDDISAAASMVQSAQNAEKMRLIALSVGGANTASLKQLTDVVIRQDGADFTQFFDWIAKCMAAIALTKPGGKPQLPPLQGNIYRER